MKFTASSANATSHVSILLICCALVLTLTLATSCGSGGSSGNQKLQGTSYHLFPDLASQQGQATVITNPNIVEVYVDGTTQQINTQSLTAGNTLRFYGIVFNDNGTLRMDCAEVNDGVSLFSTSNASIHKTVGSVETISLTRSNGTKSAISITTRAH